MPLNTYLRWQGQWVPVGAATPPPPPPDEEEPPPPGPGTFAHGEQITKQNIGPTGTLTPWTGSTTLSGTQNISDRQFNDAIVIAAGANITLTNCRIIGPIPATFQVIRLNLGGGQRLTLNNCEVIGRGAPDRLLAMWDDGNLIARRTIWRGGLDNLFIDLDPVAGAIATGDPLVPNARVLLEECWFGDNERTSGSHSDLVQINGGGYVVIRRCRLMAYNIPVGADTLTTEADGSSLASAGLIVTEFMSNVVIRDSWVEGGNYSVDMRFANVPSAANTAATGNKFGLAHQFGPLLVPDGGINSNNRWGQTGVTGSGESVTAGQLLPSSTA